MESHTAPDVNTHELARARHGWAGFKAFTKYSVLACLVLLAGMAIFLL